MDVIRQHVDVSFSYDVHFTRSLFDPANEVFCETVRPPAGAPPRKLLPVFDEGLLRHQPALPDALAAYAAAHREAMHLVAPPLVVPGGEAAKNDPALVERIHRAIEQYGICRHSYVVAVGGGAVIDLVGYAAATAHRGVRLVRVPTTVLAQNDAAVGVKNGINYFGKKNFLGTFAPPGAVLNDLDLLATLDDRDWRAGISEAVKVALIKDADFFGFLEAAAVRLAPEQRDPEAMAHLVHRCAELHLDHIATNGDPFEMGSSRPLDFGHWAAHKLEALTDYRLRHGEAVAIGIALDCVYSHLDGRLAAADLERILRMMETVGFSLYVPELDVHADDLEHPSCVFRGLEEFREHLGGRLTIMLLEGIGRGVEVNAVDHALYREAVRRLYDRATVTDAHGAPHPGIS